MRTDRHVNHTQTEFFIPSPFFFFFTYYYAIVNVPEQYSRADGRFRKQKNIGGMGKKTTIKRIKNFIISYRNQ